MDQFYLFAALVIIIFLVFFLFMILVRQNRQNNSNIHSERRTRAGKKGMASGVAAGLGIGLAIGLSMDNIALGIGIGVAIGTSLGVSFEAAAKKRNQNYGFERTSSYTDSDSSSRKVMFTLIALAMGILLLGLLFYYKSK